MPTKIYNHLEAFERQRELIKKDISSLETFKHDSSLVINKLNFHIDKLEVLFKKEKSFYLLEQLRRLKEIARHPARAGYYKQEDFDVLFHSLEKLVDVSKDALISPLILPNIDRLAEMKVRQRLKTNKQSYLTFCFKGIYYIVSHVPYKIVKGFNAFKEQKIRTKSKSLVLAPLSKEWRNQNVSALQQGGEKILVLHKKNFLQAFYIDELLERIYISEKNFIRNLEASRYKHKNCDSVFRYAGKNYFYLKY